MFARFASHRLGIRPSPPALIGCAAAFLIGLAGPSTGFEAAETAPVVLQFAEQPQDVSLAGAVVAAKAGLFAQQGLSVRFENIKAGDARSDEPAIVVRLQNARDFLIARAAGHDQVAIAGNNLDSSVTFLFRRNRNIRSEQDLAGKTIGYDPRSDTGLIFEWFLAKNSVARSSITEVPSDPGLKGLLDNRVDVIIGHTGIDDVALEKAGVDYGVLDPRAYGVHALGTVYVTSETNVRQNSDTLVRFLRALIAGWDLAYGRPDQTISMLGSSTDSEADHNRLKRLLERQREFLRPGGVRFGEALRNRWSDLYVFMSQRRLLKGPIDLSKATDTKLLAEAYRARLGSTNAAD